MILPHQDLVALAQQYNLDWPHIGPASVDVHLHPVVIEKWAYPINGTMMFDDDPVWQTKQRTHNLEDGALYFYPFRLYVCSTVEQVCIPPNCALLLFVRSSLARDGLTHMLAGYGDPGFGHTDGKRSQYTLELFTLLPLVICNADRLVQMVFLRTTQPTDTPYTGKYLGQQGPTERYQ